MVKTSAASRKDDSWPEARLQQIRFVPFYIGAEIDDELMEKIQTSMSESRYRNCEIDKFKDLLPESACAYEISERHSLFLFKKGTCVSVLRDEYRQGPDEYFSIASCLRRKNAHDGVLYSAENAEICHREDGDAIRALAKTLRNIAETHTKETHSPSPLKRIAQGSYKKSRFKPQDGATKDKRDGLSYVMTIHIITPTEGEFGSLDWKHIPTEMRRNIQVLLDPAIIDMEDAHDFEGSGTDGKKKAMDEMDVDEAPQNYEKRKNIATYMTWSSVVILGMPTENDIEEYVILEAMLQSNWYLIHIKEKALPGSIDEAKDRKMTSVGMRMDLHDLDRYLKETTYHGGSTLPARFNEIQKGLLRSSRLTEKITRYKRMAGDVSESMMYNDQLRQSRYGRFSEALLFIIAILSASAIINDLTDKSYVILTAVVLVAITAVGLLLLWLKGR